MKKLLRASVLLLCCAHFAIGSTISGGKFDFYSGTAAIASQKGSGAVFGTAKYSKVRLAVVVSGQFDHCYVTVWGMSPYGDFPLATMEISSDSADGESVLIDTPPDQMYVTATAVAAPNLNGKTNVGWTAWGTEVRTSRR